MSRHCAHWQLPRYTTNRIAYCIYTHVKTSPSLLHPGATRAVSLNGLIPFDTRYADNDSGRTEHAAVTRKPHRHTHTHIRRVSKLTCTIPTQTRCEGAPHRTQTTTNPDGRPPLRAGGLASRTRATSLGHRGSLSLIGVVVKRPLARLRGYAEQPLSRGRRARIPTVEHIAVTF